MKRQKSEIFDRAGKKCNFFHAKRGQVGVPTFVYVIGILIVLVAFLFMVPSFRDLLFEAGEKGECQWNILISALTRTPGLGFENIPVECRAKYMNVSLADVQEYYPLASKEIMRYNAEVLKNPDYQKINKVFSDPTKTSQLAQWSVNKIVADEMVNCWEKTWKGELPLFDVWYRLVDYENIVTKQDISNLKQDATTFKAGVGSASPALNTLLSILPIDSVIDLADKFLTSNKKDWSSLDYLKFWNLRFQRPPVFCIVCTRIKFNQDVRNALPSLKGRAFTEWLKVNKVPMTKESYMSYILPNNLKGYKHEYSYDTTKPVAILYSRINIHKTATVPTDFMTFIGMNPTDPEPDKSDKIAVVPYDKVILPFSKSGANCDYVLD